MDQTEKIRKSINPHPNIFPKLIRMWNESPEAYFDYVSELGGDRDYATELITHIQDWIVRTDYHTYLNA